MENPEETPTDIRRTCETSQRAKLPLPLVCYGFAVLEMLVVIPTLSMSKVIKDCIILITWLRYNNSWNRVTLGTVMALDTTREILFQYNNLALN